MIVDDNLYLLGIRHHGPGSAASLQTALTEIQPDLILLEGPPEGESLLTLTDHPELQPPVGLLLYAEDDLSRHTVYPFVEYSPEWQAIRHARGHGIALRFFDLPRMHDLAEEETPPGDDAVEDTGQLLARRDPLLLLAEAAGFDDGERWWEQVVEERQNGLPVFAAIGEAMQAVREQVEAEIPTAPREARREAWMRRQIRAARKENFQRIAVVCGAWHVPALARPVKVADDNAVLKNLPRRKIAATWIPWSYGRIASASGYGAGVRSPGWYRHLWETRHRADRGRAVAAAWLTRVAGLLREEGLPVSPASVIEAVRLAESLAALRQRPLPGLAELNEASVTTLCFGDTAPLALVEKRLIIGDRLGTVPADAPLPPLQEDLARLQKRLRLKPEAVERDLTLDLRKDLDLARSTLLHRLQLLDIPWGRPLETRGRGTFKEVWRLQWQPEFALRLIELGGRGGTVAAVATAVATERLQAADLPGITALLEVLRLADLPEALEAAVTALSDRAAVVADIGELMDALPGMARLLRYGDVRGQPGAELGHVADGLNARISVGLPAACQSLDEDRAREMLKRVLAVNGAVGLLDNDTDSERWWAVLERLLAREDIHGLVGGACYRLLLGTGRLAGEDAARRLHLALSRAVEPAMAAAWVEGLLTDSGLLLLHDERLWGVVDDWLCGLDGDTFVVVLPLLRRTFADFEGGLRRQLLERVRHGERSPAPVAPAGECDTAFADTGVALLARLLGLTSVS